MVNRGALFLKSSNFSLSSFSPWPLRSYSPTFSCSQSPSSRWAVHHSVPVWLEWGWGGKWGLWVFLITHRIQSDCSDWPSLNMSLFPFWAQRILYLLLSDLFAFPSPPLLLEPRFHLMKDACWSLNMFSDECILRVRKLFAWWRNNWVDDICVVEAQDIQPFP